MNATSSELLMRNFNEIFIELDPVKRLALLKESFTDDCLWAHPGGRIVGREGINEAATQTSSKNAMVAPQGCTRSLTKSLFNPDGQDEPREHRFTKIRIWHRKQRTMTAVNGPKLRSKIVRWT